jgi:Tfp pilus assembly protein PilN
MAQTRRKNVYIYESTARNLDVRRQLEEEPRRQLSHVTRKNRDKALHMNLGYVFFLMGALCICAVVLINYLQLQSEITTKVKSISSLESSLNSMQLANDEDYNRIISSVDLEEIRKIAIGELGMTYAKEGQIITYENAGNDYMRRVSE